MSSLTKAEISTREMLEHSSRTCPHQIRTESWEASQAARVLIPTLSARSGRPYLRDRESIDADEARDIAGQSRLLGQKGVDKNHVKRG